MWKSLMNAFILEMVAARGRRFPELDILSCLIRKGFDVEEVQEMMCSLDGGEASRLFEFHLLPG